MLIDSRGHVRHATGDIDNLGLLSNLNPLLSTATDVMALVEDSAEVVWLEAGRRSRILIWQLKEARHTLVVQCRKQVNHGKVQTAIANNLALLRKVLLLQTNLASGAV